MRGQRRFIVWGRQNTTDVISYPGDWIGFGRRLVIAPHAPAPVATPKAAPVVVDDGGIAADLAQAVEAGPLHVTQRGRGRPRGGK